MREFLNINGVSIPLPLSAFPVGAIYTSLADKSPASFIGGTWERIEGRFILAANSSYSVGSTGGSADGYLIAHAHNVSAKDGNPIYTNAGTDASGIVLTTSGGAYLTNGGDSSTRIKMGAPAGDVSVSNKENLNMPPYLAAYMWKRVA